MASRYPNQLDNTDNLPTVRDNLSSIDGSIFNRLRDAILAVERSIGINPQGQFATLADRLAVIINTDGSLNKQALIATGGIFGPITDQDVDPNAKIAESKINLNFPTALLQDEIKILDSRNAGLVDLILSSNATLQEHITRATGAHRAAAIATDIQTSAVQSTKAITKIEQSNVQLVLQDIFAGHINFTGGPNSDQLTFTNSPHQASQIFYDNRNTELATNSVQGAVDQLFLKGDSFITDHQRQLHSNGIQRRVEQVDTDNSTGIARGRLIISAFTARVFYPNSNSDTSIFFDVPIQQGASKPGISLVITHTDGTQESVPVDIEDNVQITDSLGTQYALVPITDLKVSPVTDPATNTTTNFLVGFDVFYNPDIFTALFDANGITQSNPQLQVTVSIFKKIDVQANENGLNCIARVLKQNSVAEPNLSASVSEIQVAHPNAATIVSQGFNPSALARRDDGYFDRNFKSTLTVVVDGLNTYQVQIVPNSPVDITLDTCVAKANLEFLKQNVPLAAYRLGQEMAIAHDWPDDIFIAGNKHTIRILSGGGTDASTAAGFAYITNTTVFGSAGNSFDINGVQRSTFRIKIPLEGTGTLGHGGFTVLGNVIVFTNTNPILAGVRAGDIVNIQGLTSVSTSTVLDGIRRINDIASDSITLDGNPFPVDVQLSDSATLVVYSNVVSLDGLAHRFQTDFAGLDPNLSQNIIVQVFLNSNGELDFHERLVYPNSASRSGPAFGGPATLPITNLSTDGHGVYVIDVSRGLIGTPAGERRLISFQFDNRKRVFATFGCQSPGNDGYALSSSLHGPPVNITGDGKYTLFDETGLNFVILQSVQAFNLLSDTILNTIPNGQLLTYTIPVVKFEQINEFENMLLCNAYYNSALNQIPILGGDLALTDKRYTGTLGAEQIRDDVVEKFISGPMGETRGSGVVSGLFVPSDPNATQNITNDKVVYVNGGVVYVQGVRYEISSQQIFVDPATLDISQYGSDGYFPSTGLPPGGDGSLKNGYIKYYVFVDHFGRLQTTSRLNLPASLPFVPLAKVVLTTRGILNNSPFIVSVNVVDFRLFIGSIDDKIEITVGSIPQQPAHFHSIIAATEYIDNLRYNDVVTGNHVHIRPMIIRLLDGDYQEATSFTLPPFTTLKGESSRGVRIRPPTNLLNAFIPTSQLITQLADTSDKNRYIINVNLLPEGISNRIENICFDLNTTTTSSTANLPGLSNIGAIKVTWFDNTAAVINTIPQLSTSPSVLDVQDCIFILDGPFTTKGITTVFSVASALITGGKFNFSNSYGDLYNSIYFSNYSSYNSSNVAKPGQNGDRGVTVNSTAQDNLPPTNPPAPSAPASSTGSLNTGPHAPPATMGEKVLQINPAPPFLPEDAVFSDPNVPVGYNHGGIMNIDRNTFIVTDSYGSVAVDRFYDTTVASGYLSTAPVPVSNTRMKAFKVVNNSFVYTNPVPANAIPNKISLALNGRVVTTTPVNTSPASGFGPGQESLRDQMYDLFIHRDLRGFAPTIYPNGNKYPDPKDGYGIPDGYNVPPSGGKVTEFMVIAGNTPTGLNIAEASPIRFATDTQDSIARDQHGGGTIFGTITVPNTGLPIVLDRSVDWHDRYVFLYVTDVLTDATSNASIKNLIYTNATPISHISSGISIVPNVDTTNPFMQVMTPDNAVTSQQLYGAKGGSAAHSMLFGYTNRLSADLIKISNPDVLQIPGWSHIKYIGTIYVGTVSSAINNAISFIVLPNGELAALHAGTQNPANFNAATNAKLVQTSDSFPGNDTFPTPTTDTAGYGGATPQTIACVIQYSPKINVLTASQFDSTVNINNLDNIGKAFGKIG